MINKIKSLARFFSRAKSINSFIEKPKVQDLNFSGWKHKPDRVPQLDLLDLKTIVWLINNHGNREIPVFSKRLMKKISESISVYEWEKSLVEEENHENNIRYK